MTALLLLSCLVVAGCGNQQPLSRDDAASRAASSYSSMDVYHTNAKLMTWDAWTHIGLYHPGEAAGVADLNMPPGRLVWVVALRDEKGATGAVVIVDAVSGNQVMVSGGGWPDLPEYWGQLPDQARSASAAPSVKAGALRRALCTPAITVGFSPIIVV
jgi:hypothetical protein